MIDDDHVNADHFSLKQEKKKASAALSKWTNAISHGVSVRGKKKKKRKRRRRENHQKSRRMHLKLPRVVGGIRIVRKNEGDVARGRVPSESFCSGV